MPDAGRSLSRVAHVPLYKPRIPDSRKTFRITSTGPEYCAPPLDVWIWRMHFIRSPGTMIPVVNIPATTPALNVWNRLEKYR